MILAGQSKGTPATLVLCWGPDGADRMEIPLPLDGLKVEFGLDGDVAGVELYLDDPTPQELCDIGESLMPAAKWARRHRAAPQTASLVRRKFRG